MKQDHGLERTLDAKILLDLCKPALERGEQVRAELPIRNINRSVGVRLGSEITRRYGAAGLPDDTIRLWDARDGTPLLVLRTLDVVVRAFAKTPDGQRLLVASSSKPDRVLVDSVLIDPTALYAYGCRVLRGFEPGRIPHVQPDDAQTALAACPP